MRDLPILEFAPIAKELVWGGRKLETVLKKSLAKDALFGESWEVVDLPGNQSRVKGGILEGATLETLLASDREGILGGASLLEGRFPLLFKFIDAHQTLSVQVHPDAAACARIGGGARPKTEAWYIIDREPGAKLYAGLKPGVDRARFSAALEAGTVAELLNEVSVAPGDYVYLPAGTIHAIGAGILLAEVQQSSDTTYRVFDWNRLGLDGKPRQLHVAEALEATDFAAVGTPAAQQPRSGRVGVRSAFFEMESVDLDEGGTAAVGGEGPLVVMGVGGSGTARIDAGGKSAVLSCGETRLVPAIRAGDVTLSATNAISLLVVRIPS